MALDVFSRYVLFSFVGKDQQGQVVNVPFWTIFWPNEKTWQHLNTYSLFIYSSLFDRKDVLKIILLKHYLMKYSCYFQKSFIPVCTDTQSKTCVVKCAVKTESALFLLWKTFITLVCYPFAPTALHSKLTF